jgi:hypothetical protein
VTLAALLERMAARAVRHRNKRAIWWNGGAIIANVQDGCYGRIPMSRLVQL